MWLSVIAASILVTLLCTLRFSGGGEMVGLLSSAAGLFGAGIVVFSAVAVRKAVLPTLIREPA